MKIFARIRNRGERTELPNASRHPKIAGNVFFALFAGIAMVGAVGWGFNTVLRGPIKGMTDITHRTVAENTVITSSRLAIVGATTKQDEGGDCDADGMIEPLPYRDAGASPHPAGGGYLPTDLVPNSIDPWKTEYGYCAWDAGSVSVSDADADCGGGTPRRLEGSPLNNQYAIAIVSAGRDRRFQTTCNGYIDANADDKPDTPLIVTTTGSDDIVLGYTYAEANNLGNGMWKIKDSDPDTAQTDKNLEVTGGGTFSDKVVLTGNTATGGGLVLPGDPGDDSLTGACDAANDKQMRRNTSTAPATLEICDFTGGLGWSPISGGSVSGATTGALVARWKLDETSGTEAEDSVGGHDATLVNTPTWESGSGALDGAAYFEAASDEYGQVTRDPELEPSAITIAAWVRRNGDPATVGTIIQKTWDDNGAPTYASYALQINGADANKIDFVTGHAGTDDTLQSTAGIPDGNWTHIIGVYDPNAAADQKRLYIDGVLVSSKTLTAPIVYDKTAAGDLFIGSESAAATRSLNGALDEIRLYNYAFNDSEALALYTQSQTGIGNLKRPVRPGQMFTWGSDTNEALGNGASLTNLSGPHHISATSDFVQISQRSDFGCGLKKDGTVWCWGGNASGQVGDGTTTNAPSPLQVAGLTSIVKIHTGRLHACALEKTGKIWCWGEGDNGRLGNGTTADSGVPVQVSGFEDYTDVVAGDDISCALRSGGQAWCWGNGANGQMGNGLNNSSSVPVKVSNISDFVQIDIGSYATGESHVCGVTKTGEGYCWGQEKNGEFGNGGTTGDQNVPSLVSSYTDFVKVATHYDITCWLRAEGGIVCSGADTNGAQGNDTGGATTVPTAAMTYFDDYIDVSVGTENVCGIRKNHELWCAGSDVSGRLGNGSDATANTQVPVKILVSALNVSVGVDSMGAIMDNNATFSFPAQQKLHKIAASGDNACHIVDDGTLWCWGVDTFGQIGNGAGVTAAQTSPAAVTNRGPWQQISVNNTSAIIDHFACAIKNDGTLWCWGSDGSGQLGNGGVTTTNQPDPIQVTNTGPWTHVTTGRGRVCAIKNDGTLWCWGNDTSDSLGVAGSGNLDAAAQISDPGPWIYASAGTFSTCGIKSDRSLWCWGSGSTGMLGNGASVNQADPVKVSDNGPWAYVSVGSSYTCGIKINGSLWCWGGVGGTGFTAVTNVPRLIADPGPWISIATDTYNSIFTCGIKADGSAWCWGSDANGKLGNGAINGVTYKEPRPVVGGGAWTDIAVYNNGGCGIKTDSSVWCWGADTNGKLGNGPVVTATQSSPQRVVSLPLGNAWWRNDAGTALSPMSGLNPTIDTKYLSNDGGAHGFNFPSTGRANILETTANELSIEASGTNYSSQLSMLANSAKIASDVTTGLVGKWMLNDAAGTTATASTGTNGTTTASPTWLTSGGRLGGALALNGTSNYVEVSRFAAIESSAVTISLWMRRQATQPTNATVLTKTWTSNTAASYASYKLQFSGTSDTNMIFTTGHTGAYDSLAMSQSIPAETWTYVTLVYDPSAPAPQKKIYVNGVLDAAKSLSTAILYDATATGNLFFGQGGCGTGGSACDFFGGALDDIRIYNRALDPGEIARLYYFTSQDRVTRTAGLDYITGNFKIARNNNNASASLFSLIPDIEVAGSGNVALNGADPVSKLSVGGAVRVGNDTGACTAGKAGTIKWTGTAWKYCSGSAWNTFGAANPALLWRAGVSGMAQYHRSCTVRATGYLYCWGNDFGSALGNGSTQTNENTPQKVYDDTTSAGWNDWIDVTGGENTVCGIRKNGGAYCWGAGYWGASGTAGTSSANGGPKKVYTDAGSSTGWNDWVQISLHWMTTCGIRANGTAWCWGRNDSGQVGDNTTTSPNIPVQVHSNSSSTGWTDWKQVDAGLYRSCGIRANGTAWCWGTNHAGSLGNNNTGNQMRPGEVHSSSSSTGWTDWVQITVGDGSNTCGIRTNGTLWCWGWSGARPTQVRDSAGTGYWSDWTYVSAGNDHICGLRTNGTAWCWGAATNGKLGDNQATTSRTYPVQVHSDSSSTGWTDWISISASLTHTCGVRINGTLWCWGRGDVGAIGNGASTDQWRPVQVE